MNVSHFLLAVTLSLVVSRTVRAQSPEPTPGESAFAEQSELPLPIPSAETPDLLQEHEQEEMTWGEWLLAPPSAGWYYEVDFLATTEWLAANRLGGRTWDPALTTRIDFGYEWQTGAGFRVESWALSQRLDVGPSTFDFDARTLYLDSFRHFSIGDIEFKLGGGLAGAYMEVASDTYGGAGASVFGDVYVPIRRFEKMDIGVVGNARLALLASIEDGVLNDGGAVIDELAWGLQLRRRFGRLQEKHWHIDIVRETQSWGGLSDPFSSDAVFQSTGLRFGIDY